MQFSIVFFLTLALAVAKTWAGNPAAQPMGLNKQLICYYDSASFVKEGLSKMNIDDLEPAFQFCDYLIYGYAGIERGTFQVMSLHQQTDLDYGQGLYRTVTRLKMRYPNVKVLLSVGGDRDIETGKDAEDLPNKYLELLENNAGRKLFINTAHALVKTYNFDGLDLAFQFPKNKPKKVHGTVGTFFKGIKKMFSSGDFDIDEKSQMHKQQFTTLVRELKNELRRDNLLLSATVLPNVNSSKFIDVGALNNDIDLVNLGTFDFYTPKRNPELADVIAPLYPMPGRNQEFCVDYQVSHWLQNGFAPHKINVGISAKGRIWKMNRNSGYTGVPPISNVTNAAPKGQYSKVQGLYSFQETCQLLPNHNNLYAKGANAPLYKISNIHGAVYAYRVSDQKGHDGVWVSYEDPDTAVVKTKYVFQRNLGGVALFNLEYDDFRGLCVNEKYPIMRAIKQHILRPDGGQ